MRSILASMAGAVALGLAIPAHAASDEDFLHQAMEINLTEIAMGELALRRGSSEDIRTYGGTLVIDHIANGGEVIALSRSMGIEPPKMAPGGEMAVHDQLMNLDGADFDQTFVRRMIDGHRDAIALFQDKAAEDGPVGDYAEETLPTLEGHLQLAEQILNGGTAASADSTIRLGIRSPPAHRHTEGRQWSRNRRAIAG